MYTGPKLIELLQQQHQNRGTQGLFQSGEFALQWRTKVGSYPHADLETMISAAEPCGAWIPEDGCPNNIQRPEDKRTIGDNWNYFYELPLNGYIPGSSIRGLVRSWAIKRPEIQPRMLQLLGNQQDNNTITAGRIEFLDAWPIEETKVTLDIVNPQQEFQVYHQESPKPLSLYTLGDGDNPVKFKVAIRGIGKATVEEVQEVWGWVQQSLISYGLGSRTASGYGRVSGKDATVDPGYISKKFDFNLYTQGCAGPDIKKMELRPSHWRGWLRSWILRFLLGVMSPANAELTLGELMGVLEPTTHKGCVRLNMIKGKTWDDQSSSSPYFHTWQGKLEIIAPERYINVILPIIKFAVSVGGVGRGWRRPLHMFTMNNGRKSARGTHVIFKETIIDSQTNKPKTVPYNLPPTKPNLWQKTYERWREAVTSIWPNRISATPLNPSAEAFSPRSCAIYAVDGPDGDPINTQELNWAINNPIDTRGDGMELIYTPTYKRKKDVGGMAAGGSDSHCSWVSIKRARIPQSEDYAEVVCLFLGGINPTQSPTHLRCQFLSDLHNKPNAIHLFGIRGVNQ